MNEEELLRIERGDPSPIGEIFIGIGFLLGIIGLLVFIVWGSLS